MKIKFGFLVVLAAFFLLGIVWADSAPSTDKTQGEKKSSPKEATPTAIKWLKYDEGLKLAKEQGKKVFVEFTAKWCGWCKKMHATTFVEPEIVAMLSENYVAVSVDGDSPDTLKIDGWITSEKGLAREYKVSSYPTYWFLTANAEPIAPIKGYRDKNDMGNILEYLKDDTYKTVSFTDFLESKKKK